MLVPAPLILALALAAVALAAPGDVTYRGCISSATTVTSCTQTSDATSDGDATGMDTPEGSVVSPDGLSVYVASLNGDAMNEFARDPDTGELTSRGCITSNSSLAGCTKIQGAMAGGTNTGLDALRAVAISPDGLSVYAASGGGDAIARFTRDPSGALTYRDCITSNSSVTGCTTLPGAAAGGTNTGLDEAFGLAVSADGKDVYAVSRGGDALTTLSRDTGTGALTFEGCITSDSSVAVCGKIPGAAAAGTKTPMDQPLKVSVTADGRGVFTISEGSDAVTRFARDTSTGALTLKDCITSDSSVTACNAIPGATAGGTGTGLDVLRAIVASPDGTSLYVGGNESIAHLRRDPATGAVTYVGCITSATDISGCAFTPNAAAEPDFQGISDIQAIAVSADGENVYSASGVGGTIATFDRGPGGNITFRACVTGDADVNLCTHIPGAEDTATNNGLEDLRSISLGPDDKTIYAADLVSDSVATLDREVAPPPSNEFTIGKLKRNKKKGTAKLAIGVPDAGTVGILGKTLKPATATATAPGTLQLSIKAKGKSRKKLKTRGKAKVKAEITFTPTGGSANTVKKKLKLVRKR